MPPSIMAKDGLDLPLPGKRVGLSPAFQPIMLQGVKLNAADPFKLEFIVYNGDAGVGSDELKQEYEKVIKYFLAGVTVPDEDLWVNLSPYEEDRIIPEAFGVTQMGRDLLAQDYLLKQVTASLIYPEDDLGKQFWKKVYAKAKRLFGTTDVPVNTFNKVWIVPEKAVVYENEDTGFVIESYLKVMLEEDYLSLTKNMKNEKFATDQIDQTNVEQINNVSSSVVREVIIPELEKEVNNGRNFSPLRQVYQSLILATWYKQLLREHLMGKIYVDKKKVDGIGVEDKEAKDKIYQQYVEAFRQGVYSFIKEEYDPATQDIVPRKYFSGGTRISPVEVIKKTEDSSMLSDKTKTLGLASLLVLSVALAGCGGGGGGSSTGTDNTVPPIEQSQPESPQPQLPVIDKESAFLPFDQQVMIAIGQHPNVIEEYIAKFGVPTAFGTYSSIQTLSGLTEIASVFGEGGHYAQALIDDYPNMAIQMGLYMVDALGDVINGEYDDNIEKLADWIKKANRPVYLRIGYEFDGGHNRYDATQYKEAYRYIVDRFDDLGVGNVAYVWHSMNDENSFQTADAYYPGDAYVDYVGVSIFGLHQMQWAMPWADFARKHNKAFMVGEATPHGRHTVQEREEWMKAFQKFIKDTDTRIVSYINGNFDPYDYAADPESENYMALQIDEVISDLWKEWLKQDDVLHTLTDIENPYVELGYDPETNGPVSDNSMLAQLNPEQKMVLKSFISRMTIDPQVVEGLTEAEAFQIAKALMPNNVVSEQAGLLPLSWLVLLVNAAGQSKLAASLKDKFQVSVENDIGDDLVPEVAADNSSLGGIDLTQNFLYLQIKRDDNGIVLPSELQDIENIQFNGLEPIIINISPLLNVPQFMRLEKGSEDQLVSK